MKVNRSIFVYIAISIILGMTGIMMWNNFNLMTWLLILELIVFLITAKINGYLMSVGAMFLVFVFFFHCSQGIITTFGFNDPYFHRSVIARSQGNEFLLAELYVLLSMIAYGIAYLIKVSRIPKYEDQNVLSYDEEDSYRLRNLFRVSVVIFAICIIPLVYMDIQKITALRVGGYLNTYTTYREGAGKYISLIGQFARPAISLIILSLSNKKQKARLILLLSSIYFGIMMLSGDRGTNMIYIVTNLFIYCKFVSKPKMGSIIIAIVAGYFLMGFVSAISLFRYTDFSLESFLQVFNLRSSDGVVYSVLREFGGSMISLIYSMRFVPSYANYNFGLTYIISLLLISPKLPQAMVNALNNNFTFTSVFPSAYLDSLGGSVLGELYYNFGWLGALCTLFLGLFISRIDIKINQSKQCKDWITLGMIVSFLPQIFLWVRNYFPDILFVGFWISVVLYVVFKAKKNCRIN